MKLKAMLSNLQIAYEFLMNMLNYLTKNLTKLRGRAYSTIHLFL